MRPKILITALSLLIGFAGLATSQEIDKFPDQYIDEDVLTQRVDDLTEVVNTHTEQIEQIAERVKTLESKPALAAKPQRNLLGTELKKPKPLAFGSVGSSTTVTTTYSSPVYFSRPIVTSPVVVSAPARSPVPSQQFTTSRTVRRPVQEVRTTSVQYAPAQSRGLGARLGNFFGQCPTGGCPR